MSLIYIILYLSVMLFLLFAASFFASAETAFTGLSPITIRQMKKEGLPHSSEIERIKNRLDDFITAVLIGTNFINTLNSSVATAFALRVFGAESVGVVTAILLFLVILFAEIIPKTYSALNPKVVAYRTALPILAFQWGISPVIKVFSYLTTFVGFLEKKVFGKNSPLITSEELKDLVALGENEGTIEKDERQLLERIFELSGLTVHSIMRHRSLVRYIGSSDTLESVLKAFEETGRSRLPVFEKQSENVVGVLNFRSVLFADSSILAKSDFVSSLMQPALFVPETMSAISLLKTFRLERQKFAVVIDEYGGMSGIVTLDNILRAVFGRITDEHGSASTPPEDRIEIVDTGEFLVPGNIRLDELNRSLRLELSSESFDTLGGWLLEKLGELPDTGAVYKKNGVVFIVEDQSARRIQTVRIRLP